MNRECQIVRRYQNFYPKEFVKYQRHPSVIVEEDSNENAIEHFESNIQTFQKLVMSRNDFCDVTLVCNSEAKETELW